MVHVERRQQGVAAQHVVQGHGAHLAPEQRVDQEGRRPGLEPPGVELAGAAQHQDVVWIVDPLLAAPAIAVVPSADGLPVQAGELGREHGVQVGVEVAADRRVARVQGDVGQVVQAGEQAHLGKLAHPGEEGEPEVGVAGLDGRVQAAQVVAVGARHVRRFQRVQDRLVVFVDQHHDRLLRLPAQLPDQVPEADRRRVVAGRDAGVLGRRLQLRHRVLVQAARLQVAAAAELQAHHRMAHRPVPVMNRQPPEQRLVAGEQLLHRVQQQALAEAPRPRQEVVLAFADQLPEVGRLVDVVVAAVRADLAEGLDAERQSACRQGPCHGAPRQGPAAGASNTAPTSAVKPSSSGDLAAAPRRYTPCSA